MNICLPSQFIVLENIASTNVYAMENFDTLADGSVVFAENQTAGKGRLGRKWHSPKGGIYASFILKKYPFSPVYAAFAICLAGLKTMKTLAPSLDLRIKLPNDIICENRKIGGTLCEIRKSSAGEGGIAAGIGLNINSTESDLLEAGCPASSLFTLTGKEYPIDNARTILAQNAFAYFLRDENKILSDFIGNCKMIGRQVAVSDGGSTVKGILDTILSDGSALIDIPGEGKRKFYSGDFLSI
jgi:BirA family biotin operon repressor/biotin-[acetyl-CoA-carboxylase] ligase